MDAQTRARFEARAKVMKALAHPTRLYIIDQLSRAGERCVCDLTELIGADMSTVSKHLALLKEAGILEDEKRGSMVFYRLRVKCVLGCFDCMESILMGKAEAHQRLLAVDGSVAPVSSDCESSGQLSLSWIAGDGPIMEPRITSGKASRLGATLVHAGQNVVAARAS